MRPNELSRAIAHFTEKVRSWNKNVFRNLFQRKKRVATRIKGVQVALASNLNNFLVELDRVLRAEFAKVSKLEEEFGP